MRRFNSSRHALAVIAFGGAAIMTTPTVGRAGGEETCVICVSLCPGDPQQSCKGYTLCDQKNPACPPVKNCNGDKHYTLSCGTEKEQ